MKTELVNRLSNLAFCGFYDPSKSMVTVHFFNETNDKPDVIAYLNKDMSWDIREIISEVSCLYENAETITINHNRLGIEEMGSAFDDFVRMGLEKMAREHHGDELRRLGGTGPGRSDGQVLDRRGRKPARTARGDLPGPR